MTLTIIIDSYNGNIGLKNYKIIIIVKQVLQETHVIYEDDNWYIKTISMSNIWLVDKVYIMLAA